MQREGRISYRLPHARTCLPSELGSTLPPVFTYTGQVLLKQEGLIVLPWSSVLLTARVEQYNLSRSHTQQQTIQNSYHHGSRLWLVISWMLKRNLRTSNNQVVYFPLPNESVFLLLNEGKSPNNASESNKYQTDCRSSFSRGIK